MAHFQRLFVLGIAITAALAAQPKAAGACPLLTVEDAATVLGTGARAEPLMKSASAMVCRFQAGRKQLDFSIGKVTSMAAHYKAQIAALKTEHKGRDEAGLGDYAVSFVQDGDGAVIMAIKGDRAYSLQAFDAGTSPAVFEKLRALMRKEMGK